MTEWTRSPSTAHSWVSCSPGTTSSSLSPRHFDRSLKCLSTWTESHWALRRYSVVPLYCPQPLNDTQTLPLPHIHTPTTHSHSHTLPLTCTLPLTHTQTLPLPHTHTHTHTLTHSHFLLGTRWRTFEWWGFRTASPTSRSPLSPPPTSSMPTSAPTSPRDTCLSCSSGQQPLYTVLYCPWFRCTDGWMDGRMDGEMHTHKHTHIQSALGVDYSILPYAHRLMDEWMDR